MIDALNSNVPPTSPNPTPSWTSFSLPRPNVTFPTFISSASNSTKKTVFLVIFASLLIAAVRVLWNWMKKAPSDKAKKDSILTPQPDKTTGLKPTQTENKDRNNSNKISTEANTPDQTQTRLTVLQQTEDSDSEYQDALQDPPEGEPEALTPPSEFMPQPEGKPPSHAEKLEKLLQIFFTSGSQGCDEELAKCLLKIFAPSRIIQLEESKSICTIHYSNTITFETVQISEKFTFLNNLPITLGPQLQIQIDMVNRSVELLSGAPEATVGLTVGIGWASTTVATKVQLTKISYHPELESISFMTNSKVLNGIIATVGPRPVDVIKERIGDAIQLKD